MKHDAGSNSAAGGGEKDQTSLNATKRRLLEAAGAAASDARVGAGEGEAGAQHTDAPNGSWGTVIALIDAMEAGEAAALRGRDIRALRRAVRMSARELAARLGYTESAIYDWETERHPCPPGRYLALLNAILAWREEQEQWLSLLGKNVWALRRRAQ